MASHDEFAKDWSPARHSEPFDPDDEPVTGVTSAQMVRGEREGVRETESMMDGQHSRGW